MTQKDPRGKGFRWLTPYLTVRDVVKSLEFYEKAFGFEPGMTMPGPDGGIVHAEMLYQGAAVMMMAPEGAFGATAKAPATSGEEVPVGLYVYCHDVDALFKRATAAGANVLDEPQDMFWGDRTARVEDPDGYRWNFATNFEEYDPNKMPPPSTS